jgi:hypothetical protein
VITMCTQYRPPLCFAAGSRVAPAVGSPAVAPCGCRGVLPPRACLRTLAMATSFSCDLESSSSSAVLRLCRSAATSRVSPESEFQ